jgi:tetratricopeptide (TPR) repeat protein
MPESAGIFVSHSHEDGAFCLELIGDLRTRLGEDAVWYDASGGLDGGEAWWDRIVAEITARPHFLVVLSPHAYASKWVSEEMRIAFFHHVELGKRLLPVRLAPSPRRRDWAGIREFDFQGYRDPRRYAIAFDALLQALGVDSGASSPISPAPLVALPPSAIPSSPARPLSAAEQLAQETHTAYGRERWSDVLAKTDILMGQRAMTPLLWRERASASLAEGNIDAGLAALDQALQLEPEGQATLLLRARLYLKMGDDAQAIPALIRAYTLLTSHDDLPARLDILYSLTEALRRTQRWEEFSRWVSEARRLAANDQRWTVWLIEGLLMVGRYQEAIVAAQGLPHRVDTTSILPVWKAAIAAAVQAVN